MIGWSRYAHSAPKGLESDNVMLNPGSEVLSDKNTVQFCVQTKDYVWFKADHIIEEMEQGRGRYLVREFITIFLY